MNYQKILCKTKLGCKEKCRLSSAVHNFMSALMWSWEFLWPTHAQITCLLKALFFTTLFSFFELTFPPTIVTPICSLTTLWQLEECTLCNGLLLQELVGKISLAVLHSQNGEISQRAVSRGNARLQSHLQHRLDWKPKNTLM